MVGIRIGCGPANGDYDNYRLCNTSTECLLLDGTHRRAGQSYGWTRHAACELKLIFETEFPKIFTHILFKLKLVSLYLYLMQINTQNDILRIMDTLPPSYETVVKHEIPPPPYDCVIVNLDQCKDQQQSTPATVTVPTTSNSATQASVKETPTTNATVLHI